MAEELTSPERTPLFEAQHAGRYERQRAIEEYESTHACRLIVFIDTIFSDGVPYFEELIYDADPERDLHILMASPGGDGEIAVRMVRSAQARCHELTVIIPDQAKSAATLLALGAHHILMGPTSDLGPIDPQLRLPDGSLASAKDIIAAVDSAEAAVQERPETYPLHAAMLSNLTELMVQQARSALDRTGDLMGEALKSNRDRAPEEIAALASSLHDPLIKLPKTHAAIFGVQDARDAGLPVVEAEAEQWLALWRLWARYVALGVRAYEGRKASWIAPWSEPVQASQ